MNWEVFGVAICGILGAIYLVSGINLCLDGPNSKGLAHLLLGTVLEAVALGLWL